MSGGKNYISDMKWNVEAGEFPDPINKSARFAMPGI